MTKKNRKHTSNDRVTKFVRQNLVGGHFRPGSGIAQLFERLADGKPHGLATLQSLVGKKVDLSLRLYHIGRYGRADKSWTLTHNDNGTVQLKLHRRSAAPKKVARPAAARKVGKPATHPAVATAVA